MSTDETQEAVRDAIAGAEIGEARPAMTTKRPWTEGPHKAEPHHRWEDEWEVVTHDGQTLCEVESEANARLFAAAHIMYEALRRSLIVVLAQYETAEKMGASEQLLQCLHGSIRETTTALRAANPDAFDAEEPIDDDYSG